jgi:predicted dehydrogenase
MTTSPIGVAVIGAGMAGRAHCAGYRSAPTLFDPPLPPIRYAAVVDANAAVAEDAATRYGFDRHGTDWRDLLDADDVQVVSVVVANHLHREIVEELLAPASTSSARSRSPPASTMRRPWSRPRRPTPTR